MKYRKILVSIVVAAAVMQLMGIAEAGSGPTVAYGYVYKSNGDMATTSDASPADVGVTLVILNEDGQEEGRYQDTLKMDNATGYLLYSVTVQSGDWESGWTYYVEIDGSKWGDVEYKAEDYETPGVFEWSFNPGSSRHDVKTLSMIPENFKPLFALIFIIILFITGILLLAVLTRQKIDVVLIHKSRTKDKKGKTLWKYTCGYGEPDELIEIGDVRSEQNYPLDSVLKVSTNKIVRTYDGKYVLYKPKFVDMEKIPEELLPTEPSSRKSIEEKWFLGGCVQTLEGQNVQSAVRRYKTTLFSALAMPFILAEMIIGALSMEIEILTIPPWLGIGLYINVALLIVGILLQALYRRRTVKEEKKKKKATVPSPEAAVPPPELEEIEPSPPTVPPEPSEPEVLEAPETLEAPAEAPAETPSPISCPSCGEKISSEYIICPFCGAELK